MDLLQLFKPLANSKNIGDKAEEIAHSYLLQRGLTGVCKNYHGKFGEIDLIMQDGDTLVFVEVKYRRSNQYGGAMAAVSPQKIVKIKKTASLYMQTHGINEYNNDYRFDIVGLEGNLSNPNITWLNGAFS